jgi:hypothetical protein
MSSNDSTSSTISDPPSLLSSHARYAAGAISSTLGYESGETTKSEAVADMKAASAAKEEAAREQGPDGAPSQSSLLGQAEKKLGEVTGCEGMEKEGAERVPDASRGGVEAGSGTG